MKTTTVSLDLYRRIEERASRGSAAISRPRVIERTPIVSMLPKPTKGERIASPYRYARSQDSRYHGRRVWLSDRLATIERELAYAGAELRPIEGVLYDRMESLQSDIMRLEQWDLLIRLRGAIARYAASVSARRCNCREVLF
jgi:hypothetical protein